MKRWTEEEKEYLCKYYEVDGMKTMALALDRSEKVVADKVFQLRKDGKFIHYKNSNKYW
jgi:hypothetical protein